MLAAFVLLWAALIAQIAWMVFANLHAHTAVAAMWYPLVVVAGCLLLAVTSGRIRWIALLLRLIVALAFLEAVADRFGWLGGPGAPGIAWGNFSNFVAYTGQVLSFLPVVLVPTMAVLATIAEIILGITMLLGIRIHAAALGSAALLCLFASAMLTSGLSQFSHGVYLMSAGALALSVTDASFLSVDSFRN